MDPGVILILKNLALTGLLAALAAGGLWLAVSLLRRGNETAAAIAGALALLAGYGIAHWRTSGGFAFPPNEAFDWLPWLFAGFLLAMAMLRVFPSLLRFELVLFLITFGLAQRILLEPVFSMKNLAEQSAWVIGSILALILIAISVFFPPRSLPPARRAWPLLVASALAVGCQLASGSARIAELHAGLTGAMAAGITLMWLRSSLSFEGLAAAGFLFPTVSLLFLGHFFGELSVGSLVCLILSLLAPWAQTWFVAAHQGGWKSYLPGTLLAGIPAAASFAFAPI